MGVFALAFVASSAQALDRVEFLVNSADGDLTSALRAASVVLASERDGQTAAQDILTDGRAEYAALLNALYARGHYSGVIHVYADGQEVAAIPPLDAPSRIGHIRITVDPGPRFALSRASVEPLPRRPDLPKGFRPGAPAESGVILGAATAAVDGWRAQGNAKARISAQDIVADHARATLSATIRVEPGPVLRFGRLTVEGQDRMRENRIRKIAGLPDGARFDPRDLDRAADRLRRTGVFKSVTLTEDEEITRPDLLGITVTVVEQKPRHYSFGAELASMDGLMLSANWLHRNLMGGGERLELGAELTNIGTSSGGTDYILGARINRPATFTPDTSLGLAFEISRLDEADFDADIASTGATLTHVFSDSLTGRVGLAYEHAAITDAIGQLTYRNLALPLGLTWDRRDSKTDARRGIYIDAEIKPFKGFGITDDGVRTKLDLRGYRALGAEQRLVLAARLQLGAIFGASLLGTPRDDLFYSGGAGTVRGQPYQSLGVEILRGGLNTSIGANHFVGASLEARLRATERLGLVGFVDVGRIDIGGFFNDTGDWHAGAGLGVRYATGVGPLRLDLAAPVGGNTGDGLQIYLGLGQAF
ncbi:autotransporter assembly complex protein TamA [Tabrizicola oligotrophica]|uniref:Outer membrane protein assembly factor n=1 Tax=Tabrizicola oligotrophica TaxID=2710650 RepID=A0A6M0QRY4_9RHOB|nr:autotransporter assembly complex family protein [Tabrizicola oligotrophica]NEY90260.1 outer membrane protein assembly factor [Tabrizicola oligotrophica]